MAATLKTLRAAQKAMKEAATLRAFAEAKHAAREARIALQAGQVVPYSVYGVLPGSIGEAMKSPQAFANLSGPHVGKFFKKAGMEAKVRVVPNPKGGGSYKPGKVPGRGNIQLKKDDENFYGTLLHEGGHGLRDASGRNIWAENQSVLGSPASQKDASALYGTQKDEHLADRVARGLGEGEDPILKNRLSELRSEIAALNDERGIGSFNAGPALPSIATGARAVGEQTMARKLQDALDYGTYSGSKDPKNIASRVRKHLGFEPRFGFAEALSPGYDSTIRDPLAEATRNIRDTSRTYTSTPLETLAKHRQRMLDGKGYGWSALNQEARVRQMWLQSLLDRARASLPKKEHGALVKKIKESFHDATPGLRYGIPIAGGLRASMDE